LEGADQRGTGDEAISALTSKRLASSQVAIAGVDESMSNSKYSFAPSLTGRYVT
jgi:hypothetical protein